MAEKVTEAFRILQENANDLYLRDHVAEVEGPPDPLEFHREWVSPNVPVIFRNAARGFPAFEKWSPEYLREKIGGQNVTVAVTPNGWADAVSDDGHFFMLPEERKMQFSDFLDRLDDDSQCNPIFYMQQQNSNLTGEMKTLIGDVPPDIDWATSAFGQMPDAANFWLGDKRAITSTHKDPYENIYCVIKGEKQFVLSPPTDLPGMPYKTLPVAKFNEVKSTKDFKIVPNEDHTRWICPDSDQSLPIRLKKLIAKVRAGDMLYLPSLWFHQVSQSHGCIAVNYWYDMKFDIKYAYFSMLEQLCSDSVIK
ncbi:bifunctional peptidase and (3S)-lysyl hydroxylase Jmjd7 [Neocloeon triangulifer]|uniref:bifunctional peptidase and (3S)-lysyl hydroxylase Jmjd7 n=1 Tax=Neocloeon triangulifer TaxID=2078957 RepID=UPI00286EF6E8|nr:bifunctional peptidase and (3S)-lysyl hydroxylase Jmjd7 [Neocloeon triangulifer]